MGSLLQNLLPSELGNLVGSVGETSGFANAMMEVLLFVGGNREWDDAAAPEGRIGIRNLIDNLAVRRYIVSNWD